MTTKPYRHDMKPKNIPVLIVEDDSMVAAYISEVLIEAGFDVAGIASSGIEALELADTDLELALIDISLAGPMDGVEVARRLRDAYNIGIVFLSGTADPAVIARSRMVGAYEFLAKPFLPSQVYKALDAAIAMRRRVRQEAMVDA